MSNPSFSNNTDFDSDIDELLKEPSMYRVIMLNDHYTTMDFVIEVLMKIFRKNETEAAAIMLNIHQKGSGDCGVYTFDIAQTKAAQVHDQARKSGFPLKCILEEA